MIFKLSLTMAALCGSLIGHSGAYAKLTEMKTGDTVLEQALSTDIDYAVVSFYKPSDPVSVETNKLVDGAKFLFESYLETRRISARRVGWFQVDIEFDPELSPFEPGVPGQLILS